MNDQPQQDSIFLRELRVDTIVGVWEWERKIRQTVSIDLEMGTDIRQAAKSDDLEDTLNYKKVAKRIQAFVRDSEFKLVETMAERIAEVVLAEFELPWLRLRVSKPGAIRGAKDVGIMIYRSRE